MPTNHTPSISQLKRAIDIKQKIEKLKAELESIAGKRAAAVTVTTSKTRGRKPGKVKAVESKSAKTKASSKRGAGSAKFTPEWRAKLAEAARRRWARARGEKVK